MSVDARFADAGQLAEAFERLSPGQRVIYATGPASLAAFDNPVLGLVRGLLEAGKATAAQGRDPRDKARTCYFLYRSIAGDAPPAPRPDEKVSKGPPRLPDRFPWDGRRVLAHLAHCAAMGLPCPSNEALAELLELESPRRAKFLFDKLKDAGQIKVIEWARFGPRVVEVVASGKRTATVEAAHG
jgi:hypothetical protein